ncbi:aminodeoxychorismate lyase [Alteribacter lacisalsi]|uniref:Endolytic murein transglycosylase n=1 Tax=Alteribacter lacisalsi TaxID=2045244 RepID=A0A2W0HFR6_9BACI|nr:endolytic transglycosylase MltG [Alteribacter lacisalsi]PYZ98780.1 aminodeoxychorismate lyase [Alteribacter lacisalsi]
MSDNKNDQSHTEKQEQDKIVHKLENRAKEASLVRKIVLICFVLIVLTVGGAIGGAYVFITSAIGPVDEDNSELKEVEIPMGSSSAGIGEILEEEGLVDNSTIFRYYVRYRNESGFQAGTYELSPSMNMDEIIASLKDGRIDEEYNLIFTIPEGRWLEEVMETIAEETEHEYDDLMDLMTDEDYLQELVSQYDILHSSILENEDIRYPLEGYLFPARYDFTDENPSKEDIIEQMVARMEGVYNNVQAEYGSTDYSAHELLTLASIIEGEAAGDDEREAISGVIYNRLNRENPMRLQMDPTAVYGYGERVSSPTREQTNAENPYNTYQIDGIPPGPINNPGAASISAAFNPDEHDNYYFYHDTDGTIYMSETYEEHQEVLREHRDNQ